MKRLLREIRFGWWALLTLGLLLVSLSVGFRILRRQLDLLNRAAETVDGLERLVRDTGRQRRALDEALEGTAADPASPREGLETAEGWEMGDPEDTTMAGGVRHRLVEAEFDGVDWETLRGFLAQAEGRTPPWRVTSLEIDTTVDGLKGRLRLEALDKPAATP